MANHQRYRKRKRKKTGRLFLKCMFLCFTCAALVLGATIFFKVETIVVEGNGHYTAEEVIAATNIALGENLFTIPRDSISKNITYSLPYIQTVDIKLLLPTGVKLVVQEQIGMVELVTSTGTWYMGVQGKLLENVPTTPSVIQKQPSLDESEEENSTQESESLEEGEDISGEDSETENGSKDGLFPDLDQESLVELLSWGDNTQYALDFDPELQHVITVTGLEPFEPSAGEQIQVEEENQRQLTALLSLFQELEVQEMFDEVGHIHVDQFNYLEFNYGERFSVRLPLNGDFSYKLRALMSAINDIEDYESGMMDLTHSNYAVVFTPD